MVISGEMTVMEYLVSSREVASVEPAQPEPMMMISSGGIVIPSPSTIVVKRSEWDEQCCVVLIKLRTKVVRLNQGSMT